MNSGSPYSERETYCKSEVSTPFVHGKWVLYPRSLTRMRYVHKSHYLTNIEIKIDQNLRSCACDLVEGEIKVAVSSLASK